MKQIETVGATREEAIQKALEELGVEMADVSNIEVIDEGSKGFLGLGSRPVKVRVTVEKSIPQDHQKLQKHTDEKGSKHTPAKSKERVLPKPTKGKGKEFEKNYAQMESGSISEENSKHNTRQERKNMMTEQPPQEENKNVQEKEMKVTITDAQGNEASALLNEMLKKMGVEASVKFVRTDDGIPKLEIESQDGALLIGKKGSHLETLQFLINRMFFGIEEGDSIEKFVVDTENYLARRKETLQQMALDFAERARKTGRKMKLSPMPSHERRVIHMTLQNDHSVETFSIGKGDNRCVVIAPKNRHFDRRPRDNRDRRDHRGYRDTRDRRDRYPNNRYSSKPQNRRSGGRDYRPDWKRGRPNRSPYGDDIEPGQVSE
ncbi:MAG: RNA-binding cell elongation regulator Jag/EloR [Candidatus Hydrogenedens sp.]